VGDATVPIKFVGGTGATVVVELPLSSELVEHEITSKIPKRKAIIFFI
jgi:hypothetical protein